MSYYLLQHIPYNEELNHLHKYLKPSIIEYDDYTNKKIKINNSLNDFLSVIKQEIDYVQNEWDNTKKYTNSYEFIHTNVPGTKHAVSKLKPLSRSYYKMIEICKMLNILSDYKQKIIKSFHLAEGPGGFVEALTHMRDNKNDAYHAMTLVDDDNQCVPGWRKSMMFLEKNKNVKIEYGITKDGDLLKKRKFNILL
jgi:hypothetical protein